MHLANQSSEKPDNLSQSSSIPDKLSQGSMGGILDIREALRRSDNQAEREKQSDQREETTLRSNPVSLRNKGYARSRSKSRYWTTHAAGS